MEEYFTEIKFCLKDIVTNLPKSATWKTQLTTAINFISSKDNDEEQVMHSNSDNIEVMTFDKANEVIEKIVEPLLSRYQIGLETSMKGTDFIFDGVSLLYYKCHKINFKRGGSYIKSPDWIRNKKTTIYPNEKMLDLFNMRQQLH